MVPTAKTAKPREVATMLAKPRKAVERAVILEGCGRYDDAAQAFVRSESLTDVNIVMAALIAGLRTSESRLPLTRSVSGSRPYGQQTAKGSEGVCFSASGSTAVVALQS